MIDQGQAESKAVYWDTHWLAQVIKDCLLEEGIFEPWALWTKRARHVRCVERAGMQKSQRREARDELDVLEKQKVRMTGEEQRKKVAKRQEAGLDGVGLCREALKVLLQETD